MKCIQLLAIDDAAAPWLAGLCDGLSNDFHSSCRLSSARLDPSPAFNAGRQQYSSTEILAHMGSHITPQAWRLLGVTSLDLYIPILTFVFGEAQLHGACAIVSTHRLRPEFYGLPHDPALLAQRLLKEAVHELGHTLALTHCHDYRCVMSPSHAVEWIDVKTSNFCRDCAAQVDSLDALRCG